MKVQPIRGTHDLHSNELKKYRSVEDTVRNYANIYDFNEIVTPHTKKLLVLLKKNEDLWDTTSEKSSLNYKITPLKLLK